MRRPEESVFLRRSKHRGWTVEGTAYVGNQTGLWRPRTLDVYSGDHGKKLLRVAKKLLLLFK